MYKRIVWPILMVITIVLTTIFIFGFSTSINITASQKIVEPDPLPNTVDDIDHQEDTTNISSDSDMSILLVLGDSIGVGVGDEQGEGLDEKYVNLVMQRNNHNIDRINLAVPGAKTHDLVELMNENTSQDSIQNANLIFLSIGGNDLKKTLTEESNSLLIDFEELLNQYLQDLRSVFRIIDDLNPDTRVVFLGLYNPHGEDLSMQKIELLNQWNYETQDLISSYPNYVFVPTYDLYQFHLNEYLSFDEFHPNTKGYQVIAERIYDILYGLE